jgi:hypothetical protein
MRALLGLLVTGCVTASPIYTPTGKPGHAIECSGTAQSWGQCYEKASELCGSSGYDIMDRAGDTAGAIVRRTLVIACK